MIESSPSRPEKSRTSASASALVAPYGPTGRSGAVSGRGELHLGILLETMRREGYEIAVSRPQAITRIIDDVLCEPWEELSVDLEESSPPPLKGNELRKPLPASR